MSYMPKILKTRRTDTVVVPILVLGLVFLFSTLAAAYTVTPNTWNIIGLDSNDVNAGPNRFPIGARLCGGTSGANESATFTWDTATGPDPIATYDNAGAYIYLRSGSANPVTVTFGADGCADAFFEVEINRNSSAYNKKRRYHISVGTDSTPTPREVYVEHLVSQARNAVTNIKYGTSLASLQSVGAGGGMSLIKDNTYYIELDSYTATQGYEQLETFINFPNTIFQILSVTTTFDADSSAYVSSPSVKLYQDGCKWENDPNSPYYRACLDEGKAGGNLTTTYKVKILSVGSGSATLSSLIHDFSGSSFHYNSDYSTSARIAYLIDPTTLTFSKNFSPNPTNTATGSTLAFTIYNQNAGAISGLTFTDVFPTLPGAMTVASPLTTSNTCGGTLTDNSGGALVGGTSVGIKLTGGTVMASGSCVVTVKVSVPATGTYNNSSGNLFVDTLNTNKTASASLVVNTNTPPSPPPSSCSNPVELAKWDFDNLTASANSAPVYSSKASDVSTATAQYNAGTMVEPDLVDDITIAQFSSNPNSWGTNGYTTATTATSSILASMDFVLDTNNYGGVGVSFAAKTVSGTWGGQNHLYLYSKADAGAFSTDYLLAPSLPTGWTTYSTNATSTGTSSTTFRINAAGTKVQGGNPTPGSMLYLDNVIFTGCPRVKPPKISKLFAQTPILAGGTSTLTFTITNPNQTDALSGVQFTDALPASPGTMKVANSPNASTSGCGAPTFSPAANDTSLSFSGGTIAAGGSCYVSVDVTAPTIGDYANTSGAVSATGTVGGNTASATLTVTAPHPAISVLKQVSPDNSHWYTYIPIAVGASVWYRFMVENVGDVALTLVRVDDPAFGGTVCSPGNMAKYASTTCTAGPVSAVSGFHSNTATAYGTYNSTEYPSNESVAIYTTTGLTVVKSATESYFTAAGNVLNYSYVVKNTGYAPLLGPVTVTDDKTTATCPAVSSAKLQSDGTTAGDSDNYLDGMINPANAEQITCTATYTVTAADVTAYQVVNTASAAIDGVTSSTTSLTVPLAMPSLTVIKSVMTYSDPVNGTTGPKAIPGSFMTYTVLVTNTGQGVVDNNATVITDPIPANTELFVGDIGGAGSGPVSFTDGASCSSGTAASGLSYNFISLSDTGDNVSFSKSNESTYDQPTDIPSADANGCDQAVTHLKVSLSGIFNGTVASGGSNTSFCLRLRVRVK